MNRHQHSCIHEQSNLCIDILSCKTSIGTKSQQLSRASILNQLYLFLFLDLAPPLENSNQPSSETLENEVYVEYQPSEAYQMLAQSASIIKVICTNRVLNLTCLARKDLKTAKSPRARSQLSKTLKKIEIEQVSVKIQSVKPYP